MNGKSKNIKRVLAILLTALMLLSVFCGLGLTASAVETEVVSAGASSGSCGDNLTWSYDSNTCTLTISGTGAMTDYYSDVPWYSYKSSIKTVKIGNGVTSIGWYAFYDCTSLTSVTIPNSVTSIGWYAFLNCTSLTSITIPDSVTNIGDYAFGDCKSLKSITIPNSVKSIGGDAFYNTGYYNKSINWKNNVLYIGNHLIEAKTTLSGAYSIKNGTKTIADMAFDSCTGLTSIKIPNSVKSIGGSAFGSCSSLTSVKIGNSVTSIGLGAFEDCTSLKSITIPNSVKSIGLGAFDNTGYYNKTSNWKNNVLYIGNHLIEAKTTLSGGYSVKDGTKTIANYAFYECKSLTSITIPNSVKSIGSLAFGSCTSLTSVKIGNSVTSIGNDAFYECKSLTSITIPNSVKSIGSWAFGSCSSLTSVKIGNSVTSIGLGAFEDCTSLKSITIPNSVKSIGLGAFDNTGYYNKTSNWKNNVLYIGNHLIEAKTTLSGGYSVKDGTKTIANYAFYECKSLTSITIPNSVKSIGSLAFGSCTSLTSVKIGNSVTSIGNDVFYKCKSLTSITIPNSVKSIGDYAFEDCTNLTTICGYKNSYAETYANDNGYIFVELACENHTKAKLKTPTVKLTGGKKKLTVKYTNVTGATGFQVKYKVGKKTVTKTYNTKKSATKAIKKLKKGKYKVQVRAFVKSGTNTAYSSWTKAKTVKVK